MYVRFVTNQRHDQSHSLTGVFQAAFQLRDSGALEEHEAAWFEEDLRWLKMHLKSPACLSELGAERAICWFHPRALRPIHKVRSIVALLEEKGIRVKMIKTTDPGIVLYGDGWQVVAKPRRKKVKKSEQ